MAADFSEKMMWMLIRLGLVWCLAGGAVVHGSAQDPTKTLPDAYKVQFENDHARVVRVHYDAGAKLPEHTHPAGTTVYVYLNDSEGVVFAHSGRTNRAVTRPAVKAGAVRIASGPDETHTAENPASTPSDFLRIVVKTASTVPRSVRRLSPTDTEFVNKQIRITRLTVAAGNPMTLQAQPEPSLLITVPSGETKWIDANLPMTLTAPGEFLRLDFLTAPG
jgi:hypothetical protein